MLHLYIQHKLYYRNEKEKRNLDVCYKHEKQNGELVAIRSVSHNFQPVEKQKH